VEAKKGWECSYVVKLSTGKTYEGHGQRRVKTLKEYGPQVYANGNTRGLPMDIQRTAEILHL